MESHCFLTHPIETTYEGVLEGNGSGKVVHAIVTGGGTLGVTGEKNTESTEEIQKKIPLGRLLPQVTVE